MVFADNYEDEQAIKVIHDINHHHNIINIPLIFHFPIVPFVIITCRQFVGSSCNPGRSFEPIVEESKIKMR